MILPFLVMKIIILASIAAMLTCHVLEAHGGGHGEKGSLPRYLLDHGVRPKMMGKMMSKLLLFNYVGEREVYRHVMLLFLDEYKDHVNPHVRSNYLDPDGPRKLGGRSAGVQGQVGNTNGLER